MNDFPRIAQRRERRGLTQAELADRIGINRVSLARIETGKTDPKASTLRALALMLLGHAVGDDVARVGS
jgi:transcriptional regulator with XRE-family HTH domain